MNEIILTERIIESKDWATIIFLLSFGIIAMNKTIYEVRFSEFLRLAYSSKYNKIYKDSTNLRSTFTLSFFFIQVVSISFFIQICLKNFGAIDYYSLRSFISVFNIVCLFILSKFLIERIIATTFNIEEFAEQFNLQKVNYRNYVAMLILPIDLILFYNNIASNIPIIIIIITLLATNIILYSQFLKLYQKTITNNLFYFILYLCTLEIAPYLFLYYWFTKS
ncbi:DUF4271 domain-containing protein [Myroides guanonis]|uniref:DUF4271 domain-containing protein n=1 Tax=Myroides guanonis TaxID=1150112 RepID=A0A1I3UQD2_9FLAO|nr:DUF4271 domain-containing protein [Myroides guanonis]SFJ85528.1 protein of unknown function [Myroides guanonis]